MKNKKAFTLIELLIVIAIIGLLSSIVLASLNVSRKKARDARRLSDLNQISLAFEMYYDNNTRYPGTFNTYYWINDNNYNEGLPCSSTIGLKPWLPNVCSIQDPQNNNYGYALKNSNGDGQAYKLCAYFELTNNQGQLFTYGLSGTPVNGCYERKN